MSVCFIRVSFLKSEKLAVCAGGILSENAFAARHGYQYSLQFCHFIKTIFLQAVYVPTVSL